MARVDGKPTGPKDECEGRAKFCCCVKPKDGPCVGPWKWKGGGRRGGLRLLGGNRGLNPPKKSLGDDGSSGKPPNWASVRTGSRARSRQGADTFMSAVRVVHTMRVDRYSFLGLK